MNEFALAWTIYAIAGLGVVAGIWVLTARFWPLPRDMLRMLVVVALAVPAGVVGYPGHYAPAVLVAVFEGVFQSHGDPVPAMATLASALAVGTAVVLLLALVRRWLHGVGRGR